MRDDFLSADWADRHSEMTSSFAELIKSIGRAFEVLTAQQFSAPWRNAECDQAN